MVGAVLKLIPVLRAQVKTDGRAPSCWCHGRSSHRFVHDVGVLEHPGLERQKALHHLRAQPHQAVVRPQGPANQDRRSHPGPPLVQDHCFNSIPRVYLAQKDAGEKISRAKALAMRLMQQ